MEMEIKEPRDAGLLYFMCVYFTFVNVPVADVYCKSSLFLLAFISNALEV